MPATSDVILFATTAMDDVTHACVASATADIVLLLIVILLPAVNLSCLLVKSLLRATEAVLQTRVPVKLEDNSLTFPLSYFLCQSIQD